jgi:hypothetical protein
MKLEFSRQIFEKYSNVNFNENPSIGSQVVLCGTTEGGAEDKHDENNFANVPPPPQIISRNIQHAQSGLIMFKYASQLSHRHRQTVLQGREKAVFVHAMKVYGEVEVWLYSF